MIWPRSLLYSLSVREVRVGAQGRPERRAEAIEEWYLLACSLWLARPAFLHDLHDHLPKGGTTPGGLGPAYQSLMKKTRRRLSHRLI